MAYQRKQAPAGPLMTVEQARRRNAQLRIELARLEQERQQLEPQLDTLRAEVSKARKLLTRRVRDLEATRIQAEHLARVSTTTGTPEAIYGGIEGLLAATKEMEAHQFKLDKLGRKRLTLGPSHGTRAKYNTGCQCDPCMDWRREESAREQAMQRERRNKQKQAA